jgi:hypothetical protein
MLKSTEQGPEFAAPRVRKKKRPERPPVPASPSEQREAGSLPVGHGSG